MKTMLLLLTLCSALYAETYQLDHLSDGSTDGYAPFYSDEINQDFSVTLPGDVEVLSVEFNLRSTPLVTGVGGSGAMSIVYAASADSIFKSTNSGLSWTAVGVIEDGVTITGIGGSGSVSTLYAGAFDKIYKSTNSGVDWSYCGSPLVGSMINGAGGSGALTTVYCGLQFDVYRSTDYGQTWSYRSTPETGSRIGGVGGCGAINTVYVAAGDMIYKSSDSGQTWLSRGQPVQGHSVSGTGGSGAINTLYAAVADVVYVSNDGGVSWSARGSPTTYQQSNLELKIAGSSQAAWQGSCSNGEPFTISGGSVVDAFNEMLHGMPEEQILKLGFDSDYPCGMYIESLLIEYSEVASSVELPDLVQLSCYPNPFNPSITISFSVNYQSIVELRVMDLAGRTIATLANQTFMAGRYNINWDGCSESGQKLPSGTYLAQIVVDGIKSSTPLSLIK